MGSINGFVCWMSITIFGIGVLLLMYLVLPACIYLARRMSKRAFFKFGDYVICGGDDRRSGEFDFEKFGLAECDGFL